MSELEPIPKWKRQVICRCAREHGRGLAALFSNVTLEDVDRLVSRQSGPQEKPPTRAEVAKRQAAIRAGWDEKTRISRLVCPRAVGWQVPTAGDAIDELDAMELEAT